MVFPGDGPVDVLSGRVRQVAFQILEDGKPLRGALESGFVSLFLQFFQHGTKFGINIK